MTTRKLTLTRALQEIKLLDSKIEKQIKYLEPVALMKCKELIGNNVMGIKSEQEFINKFKSDLESIKDLRSNRDIIKQALMHANASTSIEINGVKYTIVEAINKKANIEVDRLLRNNLSSKYIKLFKEKESANENLQYKIDNMLSAKSGSNKQESKDVLEATTKAMKTLEEVSIINAEVVKMIETLDEDIETFLSEVDLCLSEINAKTEITVNLK